MAKIQTGLGRGLDALISDTNYIQQNKKQRGEKMKTFNIVYSMIANGTTLLWDIENDVASIQATTKEQAKRIFLENARSWNYPIPTIHDIK